MKVCVLGAGSWGTTLASLTAERHDTVLWAREASVAAELEARHRNPTYLQDAELCGNLRATDDIAVAVHDVDLVLVAVPSLHLASVVERARGLVQPSAAVVSMAKGIEAGTGRRMSEVIAEVLGHDPQLVGALSGPNLAREVLAGQPSATVLALPERTTAESMRAVLTTGSFRVFTNSDVVGCEVGGAVKNVIAIAAGIGDGMGFGWNTKAAVITRGSAEVARLGTALGANPLTFLGLAGHGDLTATCSSPQSRNRHVGEQLGRGRTLAEVLDDMHMVAEGVTTAPAISALASGLGVPMPITDLVTSVLETRLSASDAVRRLLHYEPGAELDDLG